MRPIPPFYASGAPWDRSAAHVVKSSVSSIARRGADALCLRRHGATFAPSGPGLAAGADLSDIFTLSPAEGTAVGLSLKVGMVGALREPAVRRRGRLAAGAPAFSRQVAAQRGRAPAAGAAPGRHRLAAADRLRPPGRLGRALEQCCGLVFAFRWTGAALAAAVMGFPLMVRAIRLSMEAVDARLEEAARTLGAPEWYVFATVTLPLAAPGVLAGLILGFAKAIGEFGATITFVANIPGETQTLATAIYSSTQDPAGARTTWRLTGVAIVIAFAALHRLRGARRAPRAREAREA